MWLSHRTQTIYNNNIYSYALVPYEWILEYLKKLDYGYPDKSSKIRNGDDLLFDKKSYCVHCKLRETRIIWFERYHTSCSVLFSTKRNQDTAGNT